MGKGKQEDVFLKRRTARNRAQIEAWIRQIHDLADKASREMENVLGADSPASATIGNIMCNADDGLAELRDEWK